MDFPIQDLMDENACYQFLLDLYHPAGLCCPRCHAAEGFYTHRSFREPVLDYRCSRCGRVFNAWTGTVFQGTQWRPSQIVLILRGFAQGVPTAQLARELDCSRRHLLDLRHRLQAQAQAGLDRTALEDDVVEADEMYQNAGEKGVPHLDPEDPPRQRANKVRGHGTMDNDRPPVLGVVGRETDQIRLDVVEHSDQDTLDKFVVDMTKPGAMVNTDEWVGYDRLPELGRGRATVCHAPGRREWARDDDGDGVREVHNNTLEGFWTGLRNFLRPFRGVNKWFLGQYVAMFEWSYNIKEVTTEFLRALLGIKPLPNLGP
jgi:transposase-like protein